MAVGKVMAARAGKTHIGEGEASPHTINLSGLICGQWGDGLFFCRWDGGAGDDIRRRSSLGLVGVAGGIWSMGLVIVLDGLVSCCLF